MSHSICTNITNCLSTQRTI